MDSKERQSRKIAEFRDALIREGYITLDTQAAALGLGRSTTWTILRANHKASGLSASVIIRMLAASKLSPSVRERIFEYVQEKTAGLYGHHKKQIRRFADALSLAMLESAPTPQYSKSHRHFDRDVAPLMESTDEML
jgi:hypothetical protein